MSRRYILAATIFGISACATSRPDLPELAATSENSATNRNPTAVLAQLENVDVKETEVPAAGNARSPDDLICRRERITGSHMSTRVCRTRAEIEETRTDAQETLRDFERRSAAAGGALSEE